MVRLPFKTIHVVYREIFDAHPDGPGGEPVLAVWGEQAGQTVRKRVLRIDRTWFQWAGAPAKGSHDSQVGQFKSPCGARLEGPGEHLGGDSEIRLDLFDRLCDIFHTKVFILLCQGEVIFGVGSKGINPSIRNLLKDFLILSNI